jgi:Zn-dependent protease with chaperone function
MRRANFLLGSAVILMLAGDAVAQQALPVWAPTENWWNSGVQNGARLGRADGTGVMFQAAHLANLREAQQKIAQQAQLDIGVVFVDEPTANAFASVYNNKQVIAVTPAMLELIGDDRDQLAVLLGHEYAHHKLAHTGEQRQQREAATGLARSLLGGLARNYAGNLGGALAGAAVTGIGRSFTRDEERAADAQATDWAVAAGYDVCGIYKLAQRLQTQQGRGGVQLAFLSTHPADAERAANANAKAVALQGRGCDQPAPIPAVATTPAVDQYAPAGSTAPAGGPQPTSDDAFRPAGAAPPAQ